MPYSTQLLRHVRLTLGQNIRQQRAKRKMPLYKMARLTSIPEWRLDHFELGKNEIRLDELLRIACIFGLEVKELMPELKQPAPRPHPAPQGSSSNQAAF